MSVLLHLHAFVISLAVITATAFGGAALAIPIVLVLLIHPITDALLGDRAHVGQTPARPSTLAATLPLLYVPVQLAMIAFALFRIRVGAFSAAELVALTLSSGLASGAIGFTVAHELVHRLARWQRGFGLAVLASVLYMHFRVEHVFGHHKTVATPEDPTFAPRGKSVYAFFPRAILGGLHHAWVIESGRARAKGRSPLDLRSNRILQYAVLETLICVAVAAFAGAAGLAYFVGQSAIAVLLLETINFVEHYGLERKPKGNAYEPQTARHSWDTDRRATNWYTFNLGRHADHHLHPLKSYETLELTEGAPRLPAGYSAMMLLAWVPPLWKRVMDPLIPRS